MKIRKIKEAQQVQDTEGYFMGEVPDYAVNMLGGGSVDTSQISGAFSNVDDAIRLVNQFDGSLLANVSFIFNFTKEGAYGVYLSALDRAIKTKALERKLEQSGYVVQVNDKGLLTAYPKDEETSREEVQKDIDRLYADIEGQGGTAFGINMGKVLEAARRDAASSESNDPEVWKWMAILHLGSTIVHEAIHAKGSTSEAPSESGEARFMEWALPIINEEYKRSFSGSEDEFQPLVVGSKNTWYKKAQNYVTKSFFERPTGSDLAGRFPVGMQTDMGMAGWALLMQQDQSIPIEKRLGRQYMSPVPEDLDQQNDSYELQLRKYTRDSEKIDSRETMEDLLSKDYDDSMIAYQPIEELLEEQRPKPLMVPIHKSASLTKKATLFGWMNNLEISDGSTIPGLGDRVMEWEDADEDFREEEKWIRSQPRYNPTYDIKGFYYRYIEPRFKPTLWDSYNSDLGGTAPARRFASKEEDQEDVQEFYKILAIINQIKSKIANGKIPSTRILVSDDLLDVIYQYLNKDSVVNTYASILDDSGDDKVVALWFFSPRLSNDAIARAEKIFRDGVQDVSEEKFLESLLKVRARRSANIKKIMREVKKICVQYKIRDLYAVGGYARSKAMKEPLWKVKDIDFSASWPMQSIKVGGLLAERLGVRDVHISNRTGTMTFYYKDVKIDFRGSYSPVDIRFLMRKNRIKITPLNMDIYNRDFTMNMLIYDIVKGRLFDVSGSSIPDIQHKTIRTFFDPHYICSQNPIVILRAIKFHVRYGFKIDEELEKAMIINAPLLFDGQYDDDRLIAAREEILSETKTAERIFEDFGISKIMEL